MWLSKRMTLPLKNAQCFTLPLHVSVACEAVNHWTQRDYCTVPILLFTFSNTGIQSCFTSVEGCLNVSHHEFHQQNTLWFTLSSYFRCWWSNEPLIMRRVSIQTASFFPPVLCRPSRRSDGGSSSLFDVCFGASPTTTTYGPHPSDYQHRQRFKVLLTYNDW